MQITKRSIYNAMSWLSKWRECGCSNIAQPPRRIRTPQLQNVQLRTVWGRILTRTVIGGTEPTPRHRPRGGIGPTLKTVHLV